MKRVLLVSRDLPVGAPLVAELEKHGIDVSWCPGPQGPAFVCLAGRNKSCPIAIDADVVVLDGWLGPDEARTGMPSWHLVLYYRGLGLPVVFLVGPAAPPGPPPDDCVVMLPRLSTAGDVADAVTSFFERAHRASCRG